MYQDRLSWSYDEKIERGPAGGARPERVAADGPRPVGDAVPAQGQRPLAHLEQRPGRPSTTTRRSRRAMGGHHGADLRLAVLAAAGSSLPGPEGSGALNVTFYGVRGSTPCPADANRRYGGNTACVVLEGPGEDPIVLDLGTGLRQWGQQLAADGTYVDGTFHGSAFVTHLHWDHVQGLPFFPPADREGARFDIYGPVQEASTLEAAFDEFMRPPFFPVRAADLRGDFRFHDVDTTDLAVGGAKVRVRRVPHCGPTNGYRIESGGVVVAYVSDHQSPVDGGGGIAESVLELADGADLLIHDAQYTPEEWRERAHWGHCTVDYALHVAEEAGAKRLVLFHHDPSHDDDTVDRLLAAARPAGAACGLDEVLAAAEGLTIALGDQA